MKKLLLWLLTLFFAIAGMNYFPSVGSVILFSLAVFVACIFGERLGGRYCRYWRKRCFG